MLGMPTGFSRLPETGSAHSLFPLILQRVCGFISARVISNSLSLKTAEQKILPGIKGGDMVFREAA